MNTRFLTLLGALALLLAPFATAAAPDTVDYQGLVLDKDGKPLSPGAPANYTMQFRIYGEPSGATPAVWTESQIVTVVDGKFSVRLGEGQQISPALRPPLNEVFKTWSPRYLGLTVMTGSASGEISPRLAFLPTAFAFNSEFATTASSAKVAESVTQTAGNSTLGTVIVKDTLTATGLVTAVGGFSTGGNFTANGTATAHKFIGDGSGLTNLMFSASGIDVGQTTGTLNTSRLFVNSGLNMKGNSITFSDGTHDSKIEGGAGLALIGVKTGVFGAQTSGTLYAGSDTSVLSWGIGADGTTSIISLHKAGHSNDLDRTWNFSVETATGNGTLSPSKLKICRGDEAATPFFINGDGSTSATSDRRVKRDIKDLPTTLDAVLRLKPVTYFLKGTPVDSGGTPSYGFIAQDVLSVLPDLVSGGQGEEYYAITSSYFPAILVRAFQDLHSEVAQDKQAMQDEIARLGTENATLRAGLDDLKVRLLKLEAAAK